MKKCYNSFIRQFDDFKSTNLGVKSLKKILRFKKICEFLLIGGGGGGGGGGEGWCGGVLPPFFRLSLGRIWLL